MIMLDDTSSLHVSFFVDGSDCMLINCFRAEKVIYPLIAGTGIGGMFQPPLVGVQAAMPVKDMATATATMGLMR
jgi:hypothetical protein